MRIESYNHNTYFGAKLINKVKVGKLDGSIYRQRAAYFVELEPNLEEDYKAIKEIAKYWEKGKYVCNIANMATSQRSFKDSNNNIKIYALTKQFNGNRGINSDSILGITQVCEVRKGETTNVEYLETNPEFVYSMNREYKGVGKGILDSLKNLYQRIFLIAAKSKSVHDFYIKNGFTGYQGYFIWLKNFMI